MAASAVEPIEWPVFSHVENTDLAPRCVERIANDAYLGAEFRSAPRSMLEYVVVFHPPPDIQAFAISPDFNDYVCGKGYISEIGRRVAGNGAVFMRDDLGQVRIDKIVLDYSKERLETMPSINEASWGAALITPDWNEPPSRRPVFTKISDHIYFYEHNVSPLRVDKGSLSGFELPRHDLGLLAVNSPLQDAHAYKQGVEQGLPGVSRASGPQSIKDRRQPPGIFLIPALGLIWTLMWMTVRLWERHGMLRVWAWISLGLACVAPLLMQVAWNLWGD